MISRRLPKGCVVCLAWLPLRGVLIWVIGRFEWSKAGPANRGGFDGGCFDFVSDSSNCTSFTGKASRECNDGTAGPADRDGFAGGCLELVADSPSCTSLTEEASRECGVGVCPFPGDTEGDGAEALLRAPRLDEAMAGSRNGTVGPGCEVRRGIAATRRPISCQVSSTG